MRIYYLLRQWNHLLDADVDYRRTIEKSVNNTGKMIEIIRKVVDTNEKLADGLLKDETVERKKKEAWDKMEKRLDEQEEKNDKLEELQIMYLDEIDKLNKNNAAAKYDIQQLKEELAQVVLDYEESNTRMLSELKQIDLLTINQAVEIATLRSLIPKMSKGNGNKLIQIIAKESKYNEEVKEAAETILNVLDDPDLIATFVGMFFIPYFLNYENNKILGMDESKRLDEIKRMREAMMVIENVVNKEDNQLATRIENHLEEVQAELEELTWGKCKEMNCTIQDWVR